ncbi:unnamed protein product [Paramecium octaurelia]|uniref:protein-synthesizing GTPase n=1 Tax=Paramecium octaurelia TaxID=43137 RepID=A0A8S1VMA0_PAROT|nr:unnamed protein product [Paramecium octaurelia]
METFKKGTQRLTDNEVDQLMKRQPHLLKQSYDQIPNLTPNSQEVISRQATINVGTIGHVAHGKSTLVRSVSTINTVRFRQERVRNITIRLGYANAKIFKCPKCPEPQCYQSFSSEKESNAQCELCKEVMTLVRHISFVDCPGHDILMSTMLTGAAVMDCALLIVAANMPCPQPQTQEHLVALVITKLKYVIVIQNKVDIIFRDQQAALRNYEEITRFIKGTIAEDSPIIPVSAQLKYNIDCVLQQICNFFPIPDRQLQVPPKMIIIRSFDVNKPGEKPENLHGGVVGGSILQGILSVGDEVEIRPGRQSKNGNQTTWHPITTRVVSLYAEQNELVYAVPGGLIGVGLLIDPSLTRNDNLVGCVLGFPKQLPELYRELEINYYLMVSVVGAQQQDGKTQKIAKIQQDEMLKFNVLSNETPGRVIEVREDKIMRVALNNPVCTGLQEKVAFSRRLSNKFRLIGWGIITDGKTITL